MNESDVWLLYVAMEDARDDRTFKGFVDKLTLGITRVLGKLGNVSRSKIWYVVSIRPARAWMLLFICIYDVKQKVFRVCWTYDLQRKPQQRNDTFSRGSRYDVVSIQTYDCHSGSLMCSHRMCSSCFLEKQLCFAWGSERFLSNDRWIYTYLELQDGK